MSVVIVGLSDSFTTSHTEGSVERMTVMLPDNLESEWYVRNGGMCGMVFVEWNERNGRNGIAEMEATGLGMLSI